MQVYIYGICMKYIYVIDMYLYVLYIYRWMDGWLNVWMDACMHAWMD